MSGWNFNKLYVLLLFVLPAPVLAQTKLEHFTVDTTGRVERYGLNRRWFAQMVTSAGLYTDHGLEGARVKNSFSIQAGTRIKLKLWAWEALTLDAYWKMQRWGLRQEVGKQLPDGNFHDREFLALHSFSVDFCNRINIGRRGDVLGTYIDLGVYGDYNFRTVHFTTDRFADPQNSGQNRVNTRSIGLPYFEARNYGFKVRAGNGWMNVFAMYRVSNLFKQETLTLYPELPRLSIGLEIGTE